MSFNICERKVSYCLIRSPLSPIKLPQREMQKNFLNDDLKRSLTYPCSRRLFEGRFALRIKHPYEEQGRAYRISCEIKTPKTGEVGIWLLRNGKFLMWKLKSSRLSVIKV